MTAAFTIVCPLSGDEGQLSKRPANRGPRDFKEFAAGRWATSDTLCRPRHAPHDAMRFGGSETAFSE